MKGLELSRAYWEKCALPLFRRDQMEPSFVPRNTICHAMLLLLIVWCFVQAVQGVRVRCAEKPVKPAHGHPAATVLLAVCVAVAGVGGQQLWQRTHNWGFDYGYNGRLDAEGIQPGRGNMERPRCVYYDLQPRAIYAEDGGHVPDRLRHGFEARLYDDV